MFWVWLACVAPESDSAEPCVAQDYTWDNWAAGFFGSYCRSCHSADTPDRRGAPVGVDFDTEAEVRGFASAITRSLDNGTMPIGGGVPEAELERLEDWLACGEGGSAFELPPIEAQYTAAEAEASAQAVLAAVPMSPYWLHDWLLAGIADLGGGAGCPDPEYPSEDPEAWTLYWSGDCAGERVRLFGDVIAYSTVSEGVDSTLHSRWDLFSLLGETVEGGEEVYAGGHVLADWTDAGEFATLKLFWGGEYSDPSSDGPMGQPLGGGIEIVGGYHPVAGLKGTLTGGLANDAGAVDLRDLTVGDGAITGEIAIRDPSTGWWVLTLAEDGGGCGELSFEGVVAGSSCLGQDVAEALAGQLLADWEAVH